MAGMKYITIARKLQTACRKNFKINLLLDQKQWYHKDKDMAMTVYTLYLSEGGKRTELFQTYSQVQLVLFLRDLWYTLNDWEVPTDNPVWEEVKQKYYGKAKNKASGGEKASERDNQAGNNDSQDSGQRWASECNSTTIRDELYKAWKCNRSGEPDKEHTGKDSCWLC